ncbi:hypothetical protein [Synechococcus sp. J7-Johnson]|uniref:hypothetical protein n=1 Tax=Synechococcus sp. J7-Johnson TaxID=2823737 RepID=UPI0020CCFAC8|nr:hypothetical protein [Synechococcus sp. J7-Johnson]
MMQIHLFGAATPSGEAFRQLAVAAAPDWQVHAYSRHQGGMHRADFRDPDGFRPSAADVPAVWVSFGPIWLLAPFLEQWSSQNPEHLTSLRGLIACSSSSALTKRFATNSFDRELVARLTGAEDQLLTTCSRYAIPCRILRPTLIYGQAGQYGDRNLSRLVAVMRRLPLLPLPAHSGLRQPIHASQLAAVALALAHQLNTTGTNHRLCADRNLCGPIALGGDTTLSYLAMLQALKEALPAGDPGRRCRLLSIPDRLFYSVFLPLLWYSPKAYEAVLRLGADLSGFTPSHQLLDIHPQPFPVSPLACTSSVPTTGIKLTLLS